MQSSWRIIIARISSPTDWQSANMNQDKVVATVSPLSDKKVKHVMTIDMDRLEQRRSARKTFETKSITVLLAAVFESM